MKDLIPASDAISLRESWDEHAETPLDDKVYVEEWPDSQPQELTPITQADSSYRLMASPKVLELDHPVDKSPQEIVELKQECRRVCQALQDALPCLNNSTPKLLSSVAEELGVDPDALSGLLQVANRLPTPGQDLALVGESGAVKDTLQPPVAADVETQSDTSAKKKGVASDKYYWQFLACDCFVQLP